jgi:DNA-directed RNA polymerase subunit RPC12/RpoP
LENYLQMVREQKIENAQNVSNLAGRGRSALAADDLAPVVERVAEVYRRHPNAGTAGQALSVAACSLRRAVVLHAHAALDGKAVILLGDNNLVSLAIGLLGQVLGRPLARRMVVIDTDPACIGLIRESAHQAGLEVECLRHNLRDPLPEPLSGQFDTFETDPPYTEAGVTLFCSRAIQALKPGSGQVGLLSFAPASPLEQLQLQGTLVRLGLVAREVIPGQVGENGAPASGERCQMMVLMTTSATRALVPQEPYEAPIYAGETMSTVLFYVCTRCKARYRVGQRYSFVTLDSLKAAGCTRCGHKRFRYVRRVVPQARESLTGEERRVAFARPLS